MSHFAQIENNQVVRVIVAEQDFINLGVVGDPASWRQTSYNTRGNVHYGADGQPDDGVPLRGNFAGVGFIYDPANDVFYQPQPYPSWQLNTLTWLWEAPIPMPNDGQRYTWDENTQNWVVA